MKEYILAISEPMFLLCVGAIWAIIFLTVWKVLKQMSLFKGRTAAAILALCVSLLCTVGLHQCFFVTDGTYEAAGNSEKIGVNLNFILLPYTVLALAILLLVLLRSIAKLFSSEKVKKSSEETKRGQTERRYPFERASEGCEKSHEKSHIRK